ncbi:hypothetical protein WICMUC_004108 [Wickerhamomyces mucosus]|uniref:Uncharacterized protein n=1 Tax=Wickerhamomyces mucosus TaxID=1378264 RepID=A0A9P8PJZ5_9ASCO|nr:hypothetical protein WICMUC_004108 [Wickerhamomyces mucosus]
MKIQNTAEINYFQREPFPYSKEIKNLPKSHAPKLSTENFNQSLFMYLNALRNEYIFKKLNSKYLLFDHFVHELTGFNQLNVNIFYPPDNLEKLDGFITELKNLQISDFKISLIMLYILKDFSFEAAEIFYSNRINSLGYYNFINLIYFIDRFDFINGVKYLNLASLPLNLSSEFQYNFFKVLNILPYQPDLSIKGKKFVDLNELDIYINLKSSRMSSLTIYTITQNTSNSLFQLDFYESEIDLLLIYLDSLTDVSPLEALLLYQQLKGNSLGNFKLSSTSIFIFIVKKIIIKYIRQKKILFDLCGSNFIEKSQLNDIFTRLSIQILVNWGQDTYLDLILSQIADKEITQDEDELFRRYPKFFSEIQELDHDVRDIARNILNLRKFI